MNWKLCDYVDNRGRNDIETWTEGLQKDQRSKLNLRLDMLQKNGSSLSTGVFSDTHERHIKKIKIGGNVAIRLMLCRGPIDNDNEFTLLLGAVEKDRRLIPPDAEARAESRRQEVINDHKNRRCIHERVA